MKQFTCAICRKDKKIVYDISCGGSKWWVCPTCYDKTFARWQQCDVDEDDMPTICDDCVHRCVCAEEGAFEPSLTYCAYKHVM